MIYTLTLNPALDYVVKTEEFLPGELNRMDSEQLFVGGKGINVSRVLKTLGVSSTAMGFVAGFTGKEIEEVLIKEGIKTDFVKLAEGNSRINIKIKSGQETELNGKGPKVDTSAKEQLFEKLDSLEKGDILIMSGSSANGLSNNIYAEIMQSLEERNINFVVDASGELLKKALCFKPWLIKPNKQELEQFFDCRIESADQALIYAKRFLEYGAKNILLSLGKDGAIFVDSQENAYKVTVPFGKVVNTVGAGDSMVAGFLAGFSLYEKHEDRLRLAAASGSATAFSEDLAKKDDIIALLDKVTIEKI